MRYESMSLYLADYGTDTSRKLHFLCTIFDVLLKH